MVKARIPLRFVREAVKYCAHVRQLPFSWHRKAVGREWVVERKRFAFGLND